MAIMGTWLAIKQPLTLTRNLIMEQNQQIDITLPLIDQFEQFFTMWQSEGYFDIPLDDVKE